MFSIKLDITQKVCKVLKLLVMQYMNIGINFILNKNREQICFLTSRITVITKSFNTNALLIGRYCVDALSFKIHTYIITNVINNNVSSKDTVKQDYKCHCKIRFINSHIIN